MFPRDCLISQVLATPGQTVMQGQALMVLLPAGQLEATLEIDELDIAKVFMGPGGAAHRGRLSGRGVFRRGN